VTEMIVNQLVVKAEELKSGDKLYGGSSHTGPAMFIERVEVLGNNTRILFEKSFIAEYTCPSGEECYIDREEEPAPPPESVKMKYYLHGGKEDNWEMLEENEQLLSLQLNENAKREYVYTGYEVDFDVEVFRDGKVFATHVNGVELEKPVRI
jgi:hypothetical protein